MNAYVKENLASALIGANTFQVRRSPIRIGLFDDEEWSEAPEAAAHYRVGRESSHGCGS